MLVLTRKSNQSIMIGDEIEVSVLSIMGEKVRIGIQAPRDIPVFRKEVYLEIQQEHVAAGQAPRGPRSTTPCAGSVRGRQRQRVHGRRRRGGAAGPRPSRASSRTGGRRRRAGPETAGRRR